MANNSWFLHVDLDAFFASVEQMDHPEYRGKPVIVGGLPTDRRSVVSTASYEARKFGVHSAMPTAQAYKLCPQGIYVHGNMRRYAELSYRIMSIFKDYSPDVDQMSIDEAFIDITGTEQLFGPPEETAREIKKKVKDLTGLTVSVGLATTKYLAKIASAMSKPDGFYFIKPGTEKDFMLSLPLDKVWGLGSKSLEKLNKNGFYSTKDIYNKDFDYLEFLFGKNQAGFLYNVVRGIEQESFSKITKNHSLSAETTYPYDVSDIYTIETTIMELAHGVFFRLLREQGFSRTVFVKIRYEDFSTLSIQRTYDNNISTLDTFYTRLNELFEEKYTEGRGVRLIGIGLDNVVHEEKPFQQDLFESNDSKKEQVEQAILKLSKKHPEIKVHKARLLENNGKKIKTIAVILMSLLFCNKKTSAQTIYDININDKNNVEFSLNGFWEAELQENLNFSFTPQIPFSFAAEVPVFTQKVQLSAKAMLNKSLFFLADFADEFKKNTFTFGYYGKNYLKTALLSNRNITMPSCYSAETFGYGLSGGENQAPGLSLHFEDKYYQKWSMDFLLRYDMTSLESAVFYGMNTVNQLEYNINEYVYGNTFYIPSKELLSSILSVYIENKGGTYIDSNGKKYKKISAADYLIYPESGKLVISSSVESGKTDSKIPTILITFLDSSELQSFSNKIGTYSNPDTFLGKIQNYFNSSGKHYDLSKYSYRLINSIENKNALVIQNSTGFSPFLSGNIYDCGLLKDADVLILSSSSEKESTQYSAENIFTESNVSKDFLSDSHLYARISNLKYENKDLSDPEIRFPFGDTNPEIYLNLIQDTDLKLVVRSYTPVSEYFIDTKASAGTVKVYINGILDAGAIYNSETGTVSLGTNVTETDKIYITWSKDSSDFTSGSIAAGAGLIYNFLPDLKGDISLTASLPFLVNNTYSSYENLHPSFAAITTGITYNKKNLTVSDKTALALSTSDLTGLYSAINNKDTGNNTSYLNAQDGYTTKAVPSLGIPLTLENKSSESSHIGIKDSYITGYKLPLSWDFSSSPYSDYYWASMDVKLSSGESLSRASELELALQPYGIQTSGKTRIYLQLGVKAEDSFSGEDENLPFWEITNLNDNRILTPLDINNNSWQVVKIQLSDEDRSKLISNHDARLIVVSDSESSKGVLYAGPYESIIQPIFVYHSKKINTNVEKSINYSSESIALMKSGFNLSTKINWNYIDSGIPEDESYITAITYFNSADFSPYKSINLDFTLVKNSAVNISCDKNDSFTFILDTLAKNASSEGNVAVKLIINDISSWITEEERYHTLSINTVENQVYIDGFILSPDSYSLYLNNQVIPDREKIIINTKSRNMEIGKGALYLNTLYFKDSNPDFLVQNNIQSLYKTETTDIIVSSTQYSSTQTGTGNTYISSDNIISAKKQIDTIEISADNSFRLSSNPSKNQGIITAGHSVKTTTPFLRLFSFEESYRYNRTDKNLLKTNSFKTDFSYYKVPVSFGVKTYAKDTTYIQNQETSGEFNFSIPAYILNLDFFFTGEFSQKINTRKNNIFTSIQSDYFSGWESITKASLSYGDDKAYNRNETYKALLKIPFCFIDFIPELSYQLKNIYSNQTETTDQDITELKLVLPVTFDRNYFNLSISKSLKGTVSAPAGGNYEYDSINLFNRHNTHTWFYQIFPVQDFIDNSIINLISTALLLSPEESSLLYTTALELQWKRKLFNTKADFLIPYSITATGQRDICQTQNLSDVYQFKLVLAGNAVTKKVELNTSLSGVYKLPANEIENSLFTGSLFAELLYYVSDFNTLRTALEGTYSTNNDFDIKETTVWERPGKSSFIVSLTNFLFPVTEKISFAIIRKNSISINLNKTGDTFTQKYELLHYNSLNFLKNYTITLGIGGNYTNVINTSTTLCVIMKFGLKMEF